MRPERCDAAAVATLLHRQRIATMDELKAALGTSVDMTVFRKLRVLGYHSSYSHRGRFYTLAEVAAFDADGLWSYRDVHFSRVGSLVKTIEQLVRQAVASKSAFEPKPVLEILDPDLAVLANEARLERVLGHIVQNAIEATPRDGKVMIRIAKHEESVVVEITDTGQGMSEEFIRERLFKPFESTKSAGMGIGVFESREYVHELGGRIEVTSRLSIGTTFRVILPLHNYNQIVEQVA